MFKASKNRMKPWYRFDRKKIFFGAAEFLCSAYKTSSLIIYCQIVPIELLLMFG